MNKELKIKEADDDSIENGDLVMFRGRLHRAIKIDTGYTMRQYYSHETEEKGPGPGWDYRQRILDQFGVKDPSELPDEPYSVIELDPLDDN